MLQLPVGFWPADLSWGARLCPSGTWEEKEHQSGSLTGRKLQLIEPARPLMPWYLITGCSAARKCHRVRVLNPLQRTSFPFQRVLFLLLWKKSGKRLTDLSKLVGPAARFLAILALQPASCAGQALRNKHRRHLAVKRLTWVKSVALKWVTSVFFQLFAPPPSSDLLCYS